MARVGRKRIDVELLIFYEQRWFQTLKDMREGITEQQMIDGGWSPPANYQPRIRPQWMTKPGTIHDWEKKARQDDLALWEQNKYEIPQRPAEPQIWEALKCARTARQVRRLCMRSIWRQRLLPLHQNAEQFIATIQRDNRYPRKARTKENRRMIYMAQIMAAISLRVNPVTAVDKLRKIRHGKLNHCNCANCTSRKIELFDSILGVAKDREIETKYPDSTIRAWSGSLKELQSECACSHCVLMTLIGGGSAKK